MADIVISAREIQEIYRGDLRALEAAILRAGGTRAQDVLAGRPVRPPKPESKPKATVVRMASACPTEHEEQKALMDRCKSLERAYPPLRLLFAVPNAAKRSPKLAGMMIAEGLKSGVPDLIWPVPRGGYHGLFLEMKRQEGGRVEPAQREWHEQLRAQGYRVEVARGCEEAWRILCEYDQDVPRT